MKVANKPEKCPKCGGKVVNIVYGMPSNELFEQAERGEVVLGGCTISDTMPEWACTKCDTTFCKQ